MSVLSPERLVWAAAAAVAVSVVLAAHPLPSRFMGESGLQPPRTPEGAPEEDAVGLEPILALMPFGRAASPEAPAEARETGLGLTLHGVVTSAAAGGSSAIVSGEGRPARAYAPGDELPGGAALVEVRGDHVVIETAGRRETLSFPKRRRNASEGGDDAPGGAPPATSSGVDALRALVAGGSDSDSEEPAAAAPEEGGPEAEIAAWRERVQTEPEAVLDELGLSAGEEGYTVGEGGSELMDRAGLLPGDVVARVNGQQVGDIVGDQALFENIVASGRARLEVIREGETVTMSFPLR